MSKTLSLSLLEDPARLARLGRFERPEAVADGLGVSLPFERLAPPLGAAPLGQWLPAGAEVADGGWRFPLVWAGTRPFSRPFCEEDLDAWRRRPLGQILAPWLDLDGLIARGEALGAAPPAGLIFHISRCGSTLLTRMLGAMAGVVALAEPPPLEALIGARRRDPAMDEATQIRAIRALVALMGRPRAGQGRGLIVKPDSWSLLDFDLLRRAFPDTPFVVLHRDPLAVLASHGRRPGMQMVPGMIDWRCEPPAASPVEHGARLLGALCVAGTAAVARGGRALSLETLSGMSSAAVAALFDLRPSAADLAGMDEVRSRDAKAPEALFNPAAAAGADDADAAMILAADRWARPAWRALAAAG